MASLARIITRAEVQHLVNQQESLRTVLPHDHFTSFSNGNAFTMLSPPKYGYKLSRTEGFGMAGPVTKSDLLAIEKIWESSDLQPEIHMCECADASTLEVLSGYAKIRSLASYLLPLDRYNIPSSQASQSAITITESTNGETFVNASVEGFSSNGRPRDLLQLLAGSAVRRADTRLFVASIDGKLAGTAGMAVFAVDDTRFANLYIDSTQPAYRGRGVHRALLHARLAAAKAAGCQHAISSAQAGSGSARNIEKVGFDLAFTTALYHKV